MMNTSVYSNPNALPSDVFDLKHNDFYNFIDCQCGPILANIHKFQLISDADIFIECNDPTEILKYNSNKLNELKTKSCLMIDDKSSIILPGIIASFSSLKKRLLKFVIDAVGFSREMNNNVFSLLQMYDLEIVR